MPPGMVFLYDILRVNIKKTRMQRGYGYSFRMSGETEINHGLISEGAVKAKKILADAPQPSEFEGVPGFSKEQIAEDTERVSRIERAIANRETYEERLTTNLAYILEAIIFEQSEQSNWLGPDATTELPSRYDDLINGVDIIVNLVNQDTEEYIPLAIDVSFSSKLGHKFERIRDEIDSGELTQILYYKDSNTEEKKTLNNVPRVVVGVNAKTLSEVATRWLNRDKARLANHPVQTLILEEMVTELQALATYAGKMKQAEVRNAYNQRLNILKGILDLKKQEVPMRELELDSVYTEIVLSLQEKLKR